MIRSALGLALCLAAAWFGPALPAAAATTPKALRDCRDCPQMMIVPAGEFVMGSPAAETARYHFDPVLAGREQPQIKATIARPFAIGRYEVTRGDYARFADATARPVEGPCSQVVDGPANKWADDPKRNWRDAGTGQTDRHPVTCVTYADAQAYVQWLSAKTHHRYRLPTGAEWEYAARAGVAASHIWGDDDGPACLYGDVSDLARQKAHNLGQTAPDRFFQCEDGYVFTAPVGLFKPNAWGLYDVLGNVWEWTSDCVHPSLSDAPGSGDCTSHIDRGASWTNSPKYLRFAARHADLNGARNTVLGFRLVREID